ncbi:MULTISPECIES: hypothetical protein [Paenibacillus]|uniref:hypothetical protein n=1 Tax=Paenibacillus TaxID=44249 RepID=UPI0003743533|nr:MULTISPECIES: hypothetical protein [Paenibacillus]
MKITNIAVGSLLSMALLAGGVSGLAAPVSAAVSSSPAVSTPSASKYVTVRLSTNPGPTYYYNQGGYSGTLSYIAQDSSGYIFGGYVYSN